MANLGLDRTSAPEFFLDRTRHTALLSGDEHLRSFDAVSAVDVGALGQNTGEDLHLLELLSQRVSVVRVAG